MRKIILCLVVAFSATLTGCSTTRPLASFDTIMFTSKTVDQYRGKSICPPDGTKVSGLATALDTYVEAHPSWKGNSVTDKDIYLALISYFPCPFNPKLAPVKHAVNNDLTGHWELVPASLKIKTNLFERDPFPSTCEYFSFSEDGDMRSFQIKTPGTCPSVSASDFKKTKTLPRVIDWKLGTDGMLKVTRSDIPNYIELWKPFIVTSTFSQSGVMFEPGDLLLFMDQFMQKKGEEVGTLYFRQFRKIAGS